MCSSNLFCSLLKALFVLYVTSNLVRKGYTVSVAVQILAHYQLQWLKSKSQCCEWEYSKESKHKEKEWKGILWRTFQMRTRCIIAVPTCCFWCVHNGKLPKMCLLALPWLSVPPSIYLHAELKNHWMDFHYISHGSFPKICQQIPVFVKIEQQ
jgi:hypothetical protein